MWRIILASRPVIIPDMPIFGSDGALVGTVVEVVGMRIRLDRAGVSEADQFFVPLSWVASVTDRVTLDCPAAQARPPSATTIVEENKRPRLLGPAIWASAGVAAVLLAYLASTLIPRGAPPAVEKAAPPPVAAAPVKAAPRAVRPAAGSASTQGAGAGPLLASPQPIAEFLNSNAAVPRYFSLDSVAFAPGGASVVGPAAKGVDGIAGVMATHVNTKIKLGLAPDGGALAMRRAAAIRAALIARGVADYRITIGLARSRVQATSGLALIILAK